MDHQLDKVLFREGDRQGHWGTADLQDTGATQPDQVVFGLDRAGVEEHQCLGKELEGKLVGKVVAGVADSCKQLEDRCTGVGPAVVELQLCQLSSQQLP